MLNPSAIGALEKGLIVLNCFNQSSSKLSLKDIAQLTQLNKATILRILSTLQEYGFIIKHGSNEYSVGAALNSLGCRYREMFCTSDLIEPVVRKISERVNESVAYYILNGDDRICIYAKNSIRTIHHRFVVGTKINLSDGGSASHVLQCYSGIEGTNYKAIMRDGFCISTAERESHQVSISIPVFDADGKLNGAIICAGIMNRMSETYLKEIYDITKQEMKKGGLVGAPFNL